MSIIVKYILNSIREKKLRTAVMLLSVTLSTTLLFVSLGIGASYESAQQKMAIGYAGQARISVTSAQEGSWVTKEVIPERTDIKQVAGLLTAKGLYTDNGYYENFDLIAADLADIKAINEPKVKSGDLAGLSGNSIAVPDRFASKYNVQVGDTVKLKIQEEVRELEVVAICAYDSVFLRNTRGFNALLPLETLSEIMGSQGAFSEILIVPTEGTDPSVIEEALSARTDEAEYQVSSVYNEEAVAADARQKSMPFALISFFVLTISIFIIYSSYKVITAERLPVIGAFRSMGATQKKVSRILMGESLIYGIFGSILGIPLGYLTLRFLLYGMSDTSSFGIEIPLVVSPLNIFIACGISLAVSVLGAFIPVRKASRLPVKDVVLGTVEEKQTSSIKIMLAGLALFILSVVIPRVVGEDLLTVAGGLSLLTLLVGAILIVPLLINAVSRLLEIVYKRLFGNIGALAARNLRDNKNISQNATLLFISVSAIIVISVVGGFVNLYIGGVFRGTTLDGFSDTTVSEAFVEEVRGLDTVTDVLPLYVLDNEVQTKGQTLRTEATSDIALFNEMLALTYPAGEQSSVESTFAEGRNVLLSTDALKALNTRVGATVALNGTSGYFDYTVIGSFSSRADDVAVIIPSSYAVSDFAAKDYGFFAYKAGDPEAVMKQLRNMLSGQDHWSRTTEEFTNDALETVGAFLAPMNQLTYLIVLLAAVGVINNLLINYIQKRRATAMYKSLGLSNTQNIKMTLIEGFSVGLLGALLAVGVSYLEIKTIFLVVGQTISVQPELEPITFLFAAVMGVAITLAGSIVPIIKGKNMQIVKEIKA